MDFFIVLWSYLLTTKLSSLQKNYFGHTTLAATISLAKNLQSKGVGKKEAKKLATVGFNTFSTM